MKNDSLTAVPGLRVGHWTDLDGLTGCTVVLCDGGAFAAVDVRGGGPGTRETDALAPGRLVDKIDGVVLTGGSAFGLAAADGVMRWLEEQGQGFDTGFARVPIVPAAVLYDLGIGDARRRPGPDGGYEAARTATADPVAQGNVGAGTGASAGKWAGPAFAMKTGLGSAAAALPGGGVVGALVAANPVGDVVDGSPQRIVAGAYHREAERFVRMLETAGGDRSGAGPQGSPFNTMLAVVATDVPLDREDLQRVAAMAHDGLARTVHPVHTPFDGDTVFALSTARREGPEQPVDRNERMQLVSVIGALAAETLGRAVVAAATQAVSAGGLPAARDVISETK